MPPRYETPWTMPDPLAGSASPWEDWGRQLDQGYGTALDQTWMPGQQYAWGNPSGGGNEFDPLPQGETYDPVSSLFGAQTTQAGIDSWLKQAHPEFFNFVDPNMQTNAGAMTSKGGDWSNVDRWNDDIQKAARKVAADTGVYVPLNLIKSVMKVESNGVWTDSDPGAGAIGVMQVMPDWGNTLGLNLLDPYSNVLAGVTILAQNYLQGSPSDPNTKNWEWAVKRYLGLGAPDAYGTDANSYWQAVSQKWNELGSGTASGQQAGPNTSVFNAIWGGYDAPITQEYGHTEFSDSSGSYYDFGSEYTRDGKPMGHTGIDVGLSYGTPLYAPQGGQVVLVGSADGQNYFYCDRDVSGCGPNHGELAIQYANGDQLILGHMSQITVKVGQKLQPGQFVGYSGAENGAHVHVEYRRWVGEGVTKSGWELVNPKDAISGVFSGSYGQSGTGPVLAAGADDWNTFMKNAALGLPISGAATVGGFHDWLRAQMGVGGGPNVFTGGWDPNNKTKYMFGGVTDPILGSGAGGGAGSN